MNNKIYERNIPSHALKPNFDFRPQPTKYSEFQIIDQDINPANTMHYSKPSFNPGSRGPTDDFLEKIDLESYLRNQYMALQRSSQAVYVPNSNSDLYHNPMNYEKEYMAYSATTQREVCKKLDPNIFHNSTRYYLKKE